MNMKYYKLKLNKIKSNQNGNYFYYIRPIINVCYY